MKYDAVAAKIFDEDEDKIFIFFLDPETNIMTDGLNILDNTDIYDDLKYNVLVVCEVTLKDGTEEMNIDINKFIKGEYNYGLYDIFIHIKDIRFYSIFNENKETKTIKDTILSGEFQDIAKESIEMTKKEIEGND